MFVVKLDNSRELEIEFYFSKSGDTVCLVSSPAVTTLGKAHKVKEDLFYQSHGQKIALTNALIEFDEKTREMVWKEYLKRYKSLICSDNEKKRAFLSKRVYLSGADMVGAYFEGDHFLLEHRE